MNILCTNIHVCVPAVYTNLKKDSVVQGLTVNLNPFVWHKPTAANYMYMYIYLHMYMVYSYTIYNIHVHVPQAIHDILQSPTHYTGATKRD